MTKRYDASSPREYEDRDGNTKTAWTRVGAAFEKDGKITVLLDAYPLPGKDGHAKIILMEPRERSEGGTGNDRNLSQPTRRAQPQAFDADLDDDVPF